MRAPKRRHSTGTHRSPHRSYRAPTHRAQDEQISQGNCSLQDTNREIPEEHAEEAFIASRADAFLHWSCSQIIKLKTRNINRNDALLTIQESSTKKADTPVLKDNSDHEESGELD